MNFLETYVILKKLYSQNTHKPVNFYPWIHPLKPFSKTVWVSYALKAPKSLDSELKENFKVTCEVTVGVDA